MSSSDSLTQQNGVSGAALASDETTCLLVASCDAYSDAWPPFFALFRKYWPDCPYPVYLMTNHERPEIPGVRILALGEDAKWASNMLRALEIMPCEQLLYFQEDYFLQRPVSTALIRNILDFARVTGAGFIRLSGAPDYDRPHENSLGLGLLAPGGKFRVSLQAALWKKSTLLRLLVPGESGWEMEIEGSRRSAELHEPFFCPRMRSPIVDYYFFTGILKGKWVPGALRLCRREGIEVDTSRRGVHGEWPFLVRQFRNTPLISACRKWLRRMRGRAA